jgi:hypothetical protein
MSFDALAWAWNQKTGSAGRKATLMGVAQFADEDGYCWPGQKMLAEYTEQSVRTVREHLVALEAEGYLKRVARKRPDGTNTSDAYYLNLSKPHATFETKKKRQAAESAASEKPKTKRQFSPAAESASGEKQQEHAAKSAGHEPVTVKPKGLTEPVKESAARPSLPEWLDPDLWTEWVDYRQKRDKKNATEYSKRIWLRDMTAVRDAGLDVRQAVEASIGGNWSGIYLPKSKTSGVSSNKTKSLADMDYSESFF